MAKIIFNNKNYEIDPASLSESIANLESHLSTVMNGSGAAISLGGLSYNVDSTKLSNATNTFVTHLGTIAGNGTKVVVNGVVYNVDSTKTSGAVADLETVLGGLNAGGGDTSFAAGLYQTGAIALYNEQGAEAIEGMLITPWDELVESGAIINCDGAVLVGRVIDNLPGKNEYGFYYGVPYDGVVLYEDGSMMMYDEDMLLESLPAGTIVYSANEIDLTAIGACIMQVVADGRMLVNEEEGIIMRLGNEAQTAHLNGDLILPSDDKVNAIYRYGFVVQSSLTGVIISDSIVNIDVGAFSHCDNLTIVTIPDSVTSIGYSAFSGCTSLSSIVIPDSVTSIGTGAFGDTGLTSVTISKSNSITAFQDSLFIRCKNLTSITIPDSVTSIGVSAFKEDSSLTSITIPDSVTSIKQSAFENAGLVSVTIPNSVTSIGFWAFRGCNDLTNVTFDGTMAQWNAIDKGGGWIYNTPVTYVQCSDGQVSFE